MKNDIEGLITALLIVLTYIAFLYVAGTTEPEITEEHAAIHAQQNYDLLNGIR